MRRPIAAFLLLALGGSCVRVEERKALQNCQFSLQGFRILDVTPFRLRFGLRVGVYNPNRIDVIVDRFDYAVVVNGRKVGDGQNRTELTIPPGATGTLDVVLRANTIDAALVATQMRRTRSAAVTLRGTSYVRVPWGTFPVPFQVSRSFRL